MLIYPPESAGARRVLKSPGVFQARHVFQTTVVIVPCTCIFAKLLSLTFLETSETFLLPAVKSRRQWFGGTCSPCQLLFIVSVPSCTTEFSKQQEHSLFPKPRTFSSRYILRKVEKISNERIASLGPCVCGFLRISSEFAGISYGSKAPRF